MKKFCELSREHITKLINFKKKKMKLLTKEQQESYKKQNFLIFVKKKLKINIRKIRNTVKIKIIVITQESIEILLIAYVI